MNNSVSLTLRREKTPPAYTLPQSLSLLLPGVPLSTGLWGMLAQMGSFDLVLPVLLSLLTMIAVLLLGRSRRAPLWTAIALGVLAALCLVFHTPLQTSLAAFLNGPAAFLTRMTGLYHLPFAGSGSAGWILALLAVLIGLATGALVQQRHPLWLLVLLPGLLPQAMGLLPGGWPLALYLLGAALLAVTFASGPGRPLAAAALIAVLTGGLALLAAPMPASTAPGQALAAAAHRWRYEQAPNPLPEGDLRSLAPYTPSRDEALEVTMDHWTPLYIRGFVGSVYTGTGWEQIAPADAAAQAETLYSLQKDNFYPATQLSAGWSALGVEPGNAVTIHPLGACRAQAYTPYGMADPEGFTPDPRQLTGEGMERPDGDTFTASLYPVTDSYLLQGRLSHARAPAYRQAEAVYRDWVDRTCLAVPEDTYNALSSFVQLPERGMTTTRARAEVTRIVDRLLTYQEATLTASGDRDFLTYVLTTSPQGYSVHYATLTALLLRSCGIPARYVEGYVVTPAMAEAMPDGEPLTLRQLHAQAWCEFYLDGVGWLPLDTVPGHDDWLTYPLPPDGAPTQDDSGEGSLHLRQSPQTPQEKPLHIDQEKDKDGHSHWVYLRAALSLVLLSLLLALSALLIRVILLRRRALRRRAGFADPDARLGTGRMLAYSLELLALLGLRLDNRSPAQCRAEIAALLSTEEYLDDVLPLYQELWFSDHPMGEAQRSLAQTWLSAVETAWRQQVPRRKRFVQRWLRGRVL